MISLEELSAAVENNELIYYYQPKISLITGRLSGCEALIRWPRSDGGITMPSQFIPQAEASGYITELGLRMFPRLVADLLIIHDIHPDLVVSFNLSARDFTSPDMGQAIRAAITHEQIDPARLQVELTEASLLLHDRSEVRDNLQMLADTGVTLAMDDYGTGYSSIDTLSRWPFDIVKLDQGLIRRIADSEKCATIVEASIRMAHQLGMGVVAEGIESAACYEFLLHAGCTDAQGFWLGRPMVLAEFITYVQEDRRWSGLPTGLIHMALLDHVHWRQALITEVTNLAFHQGQYQHEVRNTAPEMDPHQCGLGRWYYGPGQEFRGHDLFDQLEAPHQRLHQLGRELLEATRRGEAQQQLVERLRELTRQSAQLLELLQELESEALLSCMLPSQGSTDSAAEPVLEG